MKFEELVLVLKYYDSRAVKDVWYHSKKAKDLIGDLIVLKPTERKLNLLKKHLRMPKFDALKRLQLIFVEWYDDNLTCEHLLCEFVLKNLQKQFPNLYQLEMEFDDITLVPYKVIKHRTLKVLYLNEFNEIEIDFTIDCPSLEVLYWGGNFNTIKIKHPNSVIWFGGDLSDYAKRGGQLSSRFKNLQYFDFNGAVWDFDEKDLVKLNALKEIRYSQTLNFIAEYEEEDYQEGYEQFVEDVIYVLNKRTDVKFYLQDKQMNEVELRNEIEKYKLENVERRKERAKE